VQKLSYQKYTPKLTPGEKIEFEVIGILIEKTLHVSSKQKAACF